MKKTFTIVVVALSILFISNCGATKENSGNNTKQTKEKKIPGEQGLGKFCEEKEDGSCGPREQKITEVFCEQGNEKTSLSALIGKSNGNETFVLHNDCTERFPIIISKHRITIEGNGKTIFSQHVRNAVIRVVSARDISIDGVVLTGGSHGLWVDRYSSVVTRDLTIKDSTKIGMVLGGIKEISDSVDPVKTLRSTSSATESSQANKDYFGLKGILIQLPNKVINVALDGMVAKAHAGVICEVPPTAPGGGTINLVTMCGNTNLLDNVSGILVTNTMQVNITDNVNVIGNGSGYGLRVRSGNVHVFGGVSLSERSHINNQGLQVFRGATVQCSGTPDPTMTFSSGKSVRGNYSC